MELEEMKNIWGNMPEKKDLSLSAFNEKFSLEFNKQTNVLQVSEIVGLTVAYALTGVLLYHFGELNNWYLKISGLVLMIYFLAMPLYTMAITRKMRKPDLIQSNYKQILEHFYIAQRKLKQAEKITFIANPFLFISATIIFTKIYADIDLFSLKFGFATIIIIVAAFFGAVLFNAWAFKKRERYLQSVTQLLEQQY